MKWGLNVSLKYLTPSAVFRCSQSRSPFGFSVLDTLFFLFKHCKIHPVVDQLLVLKPRRRSIKESGIFAVIPLPGVCRSGDSARYDPTNDSAGFSLVSAEKSSRSLSHSSLTLLKIFNNTHSREILCTTRSCCLIKTQAPLPFCG